MIKCFMGNNKEDYFEYIDIITGTIRRKRTGLFPRDNENIFIADNNITIPKSVKDKLGDKIQNALPISSEKFHYSTKTSLQSPSEHNIQAPEYSQNTEKLQLSPADSLAPITFLNAKVKLEEDKQLIVKNNKSLSDDSIVTVDIPETAIITQRHVKEKLQIIKDTADSGKGNGFQEIKTEVERQILAEVEKETIELDEENLLQEQLTQRLAREEEKERQLLDTEDLGELEEQGIGVGNLDLEVAEERHVQELEPPLEEEDDRQLLDAEDLGELEEHGLGVGNLDLEVAEERQALELHVEEEEARRLELREEYAVEYVEVENQHLLELGQHIEVDAEEHVGIENQHAVEHIEPHLEEEDDRQLLDAEDLGELEEHGLGVGNLDLEVAEERQALELHVEEEEVRRLELREEYAVEYVEVENQHLLELGQHIEVDAEEHVGIGNQHAVEHIEPPLEEEDDRQLLDAEDLGELEEHGLGVGNLDLEVAEERQALELHVEEEEVRRLELREEYAVEYVEVENQHLLELGQHIEVDAEEHVGIENQHAVEHIEPHLEEEDDRQLLDAEGGPWRTCGA
ncbi:hypothetical protein MPCS_00180 [Candidatus Megaera polyxenophila]|nr:hypothetical protein MPCS_00180 [Candidatus Megaera polyxenophila]